MQNSSSNNNKRLVILWISRIQFEQHSQKICELDLQAGVVSEDEYHDSSTCSGIHGSISFSKGVPGGNGVKNVVGSNCMSVDCCQNAGQLPCPSLFSSGESTHQPKTIMIPI
ncbi:unnamed protein product [Sphagnum troendelagicum]|uniref:Hydrophobin n=1 Tax=Sphagnum jensenii TaxID=128206 RepID=A0ABP1AK95_9BRYO